MTIREIRQVGDPVLRTSTEPVTTFDARLAALVEDMFETMYDAPGVGLAANQIGVGLRLFVYDCTEDDDEEDDEDLETEDEDDEDDEDDGEGEDDDPRSDLLEVSGGPLIGVVCNPRLTRLGGALLTEAGDPDWVDGEEGCLSVVGLTFVTPRWSEATVEGVDATGAPVVVTGRGLLARCLQHETDHLDGKLYLDRLVGAERAAARKALSGG